ncbi:hypothetical protein NQZ68_031091, partial [Dissostichus eleginoides]
GLCRTWQAEREAWRAMPRLSYSHIPPTEGFQSSSVEVLRTEPSAQHEFEKNMERLFDILSSCPPPEPQKSSASSWSFRQQKASERWKEARPHHLQCLLEKEAVGHPLCGLCHEPAVIRCRECLPEEWFCGDCDQWIPDLKVLLKSGYWPASVSISTLYTLDLLSSFEELKVISPGFSRQTFAKLLEHRTKCGGRSGPVNGDALQRSLLEFSYASYEEDQLCCGAPFICPACTPEMLAVSADGNRKLYLFRRSGSSDDSAFFNGLFVAEDCVVAAFVDKIQRSLKNTQGRGTCGDSQWTAARETSRRASKLDEEGMEVSVCRHGFLLKALNMYRGEIFAYPLYLQKELMPAKAKFFAMDVACKYWPYMEKAASVLPALQELTTMKPFLSVMHARAHATNCEIKWSGKNQEGAGMTAGEEVEQVNSYLSPQLDMLTVHAMGWNRKKGDSLHQALSTRYVKTSKRLLEETASLEELKTELHCVSDDMVSTWISDLADDKKRLNQEILKYNQLVHDSARGIDVAAVEHSLSGGSIMSALWPWEVHGMANFTAKKKILDQVMLTRRLQEEKGILLLEMTQHCTWLQNMAVALKNKVAEEDVDKGNGGLWCTLRRKHSEASERLQVVLQQYKTALGPDASFLQHEEESQSGLSSPDTSEDEEGNII